MAGRLPLSREHERWRWGVEVRYLAGVPLLSQSPTLDDIGVSRVSVSRVSVRRQSHIRLTPEHGGPRRGVDHGQGRVAADRSDGSRRLLGAFPY